MNNIDGVNQWDAITQNKESRRSEFIYNIDPLGSRHDNDLCQLPTESIRFYYFYLYIFYFMLILNINYIQVLEIGS